jgi:replicative DNA helicase
MRKILFSCFGKSDEEYTEYLEQLLVENETLAASKITLLNDKEIELIQFMLKSFENSGQFPNKSLFQANFPDLPLGTFIDIPELPLDDYRVYISNMVNKRTNRQVSKKVLGLNKIIEEEGFTEELMEEIEEYRKMSNKSKSKTVNIDFNFHDVYKEKLTRPRGLTSGIKAVDEKIGGMNEGTLTTIAGFTSHFKTTWALNIAYLNTYNLDYNLVYISLETPKEDMYFNLYCRHSYESQFSGFMSIPHEKMRLMKLSTEELEYLNNVIIPNLDSPSTDKDGNPSKRGKLIILDESDFSTMSFTDIYNVLEEIDIQLDGKLDGFFVDYAQLCKFTDSAKGMDDNRVINSYINFFRRLTQKFRAGKNRKKLIGIILSQINRTQWIKASKKNGLYDLTCLADANELERGSYRVLTTYTDEDKKTNRSAQVQILKNRGGPTMWEPSIVTADGEVYYFGDDNPSMGQSFGGNIYSVGDTLIDDIDSLSTSTTINDLRDDIY